MADNSKPYHVFLSHSHADAEFVKQLAEKLQDDHNLEPWLDQWELIPGRPFVRGMAKGLNEAASCAVCLGNKTPAGWFQQEIERAQNRQTQEHDFGVIPVILPGGDPATVDNFLELNTWVDLRKGLDDEEAIYRLVCGIKGERPRRRETKPNHHTSLLTVPIADNPFFTERGNELAELERTLKKRGIAALTGMGGMGKTQTAAKYSYLHRDEYSAVLWVRAENEETLYADFTRLAALLDLPERTAQEQKLVVQAVKRWLDEQPSWLLVLDNVVDLNLVRDITRKAIAKDRHIIVTTQSKATGAIKGNELSTMNPAEGALLLLRRANFIGPDAPLAEAQPEDIAVAKLISEKLGGLPLALGQAGVYISETDCGLAGYRELLNENLPELLAERDDLDFEHESVAKTVIKSMQELTKRNPAAADLVTATAFLSPDAIPEEIFTEGASEFAEPLKGAAGDKLAWNEAIAATLKFSLVDRDSDKKTFSVHRTLQTVIRWSMNKEEQHAWAERAVGAVGAAFPEGNFDVPDWPRCERLLPQALACAGLVDEFDISTLAAGLLLNQTAYYLDTRARFNEAEPMYRRALAIVEAAYGSDDHRVGIRLNNLAELLRKTGRPSEAEPLYRRALAIDEKAYGPDDPELATDLNNLALLLKGTNRYQEAEPLYRRALDIFERSYGQEHANVAVGLSNLATLLLATNRSSEAEPLMRRALSIDEKSLEPEHPDVAIHLNNLALLLQDTGRLAEAEPLLRRAVLIAEKSLGPDHPATLLYVQNLGLLRPDAAES